MNLKFINLNMFTVWHDQLGHLGSIMIKRIVESSYGHLQKNQKILRFNKLSCVYIRSSQAKVRVESLTFSERVHINICGPINLPSRPFRYLIVLIDTSSR